MVFFTCNHCGDSVKKPSVEKHYQTRCRGANKNVSCMDCLKDFYGEEYVAHIKCISEAEKYSGKDYVHKEAKNSNAKKQESWMDIIRAILESKDYNLTPPVRNAFQRLQSVDNVPRKKAKFENFVANCMRMPKPQATQVWNILEQELTKMKQAKQDELAAAKANKAQAKQENGVKREAAAVAEQEQPSKKKSKTEQNNDDDNTEAATNGDATTDATTTDEFQWGDVLAKIVAKHETGIALEKLKKKLLKKYTKKLSLEQLTEKQEKKFEKKFSKHLKKCNAILVENELVRAAC